MARSRSSRSWPDSTDAEILLIGFGLPGENAHAPNEWIDLDNIRRGRQAMVDLYEELARVRSE